MKIKKLNKGQQGFTIIEVMFVLVIAALIMLLVLVAIPQLQRNQRNSARKNDAGRIATAVSNYVANNNGTAITTTTGTAASSWTVAQPVIMNELGNMNQTDSLVVQVGAQAPFTTTGQARVVLNSKCGANGATVAASNSRQYSVQYALESSKGVTGGCVDV